MARGTHWWNEPPLWAWIAMVVSAVAVAVLQPVALSRTAPHEVAAEAATGPTATGSAAGPTTTGSVTSAAPSSDEPAPASSVGAARIVVIGDGDSAGAGSWPAIVDDDLADGEVDVAAEAGAGYAVGRRRAHAARPGRERRPGRRRRGRRLRQPQRAGRVGRRRGHRCRRALQPDPRERSGRRTAGDRTPLVRADLPAGVRNNRDVIRDAAEAAEATFVDPLSERWFVDRSVLLTSTGNPNTAGQVYLAGLIEPLVRDVLPG